MGFKADGIVVAVPLEGAELTHPIDDAPTNGSPLKLTTRLTHRIFAVAVADAVFGQKMIVVGIRRVAGECGGIAGVQLSMKFGSGTPLSVSAASLPLPVLHAISFSSSRIMACLAQARAASLSFWLMAAR